VPFTNGTNFFVEPSESTTSIRHLPVKEAPAALPG
jgi:hypothetical protein